MLRRRPRPVRTTGIEHLVYGAHHDVESLVDTHLFGICPNNSGSTFLMQALATSRATWNLPMEGQMVLGFRGPAPNEAFSAAGLPRTGLFWAYRQEWIDAFSDPRHFDWPHNRKAWYFVAYARHPEASVFYTKSPMHLLIVDQLIRHFRNPKFLFMVRNPYAVCEGICRSLVARPAVFAARIGADVDPLEAAAIHVVHCLERQRHNIETHGDRGVFFTYETMCAEPERVAREIHALVPAVGDLNLHQRLPVKRRRHEILTDMNARQIARLDAGQVATLSRVFRAHRDTLGYFGYDLIEAGR